MVAKFVQASLYLFVLLALFLAACSGEPVPEPTATQPPATETAASTASERPTLIPRIGTDIKVALPEGDPERGSSLARTYFCSVCHGGTTGRGPTFASEEGAPSVTQRAAARITEADYAGSAVTAQEYLVESLIVPDIYIVPGDWDEHDYMSVDNFHLKLTVQDTADLVAWLYTIE